MEATAEELTEIVEADALDETGGAFRRAEHSSEETAEYGGPSEELETLEPGQHFDRYVVVRTLGVGGMGVVYEAYDPKLERRVALKMLRIAGAQAQKAAHDRLVREAKALAKLSHPNVLAIFDVGVFEGDPFLATELVEGQTLSDWFESGERDWREVVEVLIAAGRGLAAAHEVGLVHRDFKPDNVILGDDGRVLVLDFGLVRSADAAAANAEPERVEASPSASIDLEPESERGPDTKDTPSRAPLCAARSMTASSTTGTSELTRVGAVMGTPSYMAPEQHAGHSAGPAADQYAFCVTAFQGLYGCKPFRALDLQLLAEKKLNLQFDVPKAGRVIPRWLDAAIRHGLAPDARDRFARIDELLARLESKTREARRSRVTLFGAVFMLWCCVLGTVGLSAMLGDESCDTPVVAGQWGSEQRRRARLAFEASGLAFADDAWFRVDARMTKYRDAWLSAYAQSCGASASGLDARDRDLRMTCLQRAADGFSGLGQSFVDADAKRIESAVKSVHGLPSLDDCEDVDALRSGERLPDDPQARAEIIAIRHEMLRARTLAESGKRPAARALARQQLARARAVGHRPLLAEVHLGIAGLMDANLGDEQIEHIRTASLHALASGRYEEAAHAADMLFFMGSYLRNEVDAAGDRLRSLEALVQAAGNPPDRRSTALFNRAVYSGIVGDHDTSLEAMHESLAVAREAFGDASFEVAKSLGNVADSHGFRHEFELELEYRQRSLDTLEGLVGGSHPSLVPQLTRIVLPYLDLGDFEEAARRAEHAVRACSRILGRHHSDCVDSHSQSLRVAQALGDRSGARRALDAIESIQAKAGTRVLAWIPWAQIQRSGFELDLGHPKRAAELAREGLALTLGEARLPESTLVAGAHLAVADAAMELGETQTARQSLELARIEARRPSANAASFRPRILESWLRYYLMTDDLVAARDVADRFQAMFRRRSDDDEFLPSRRFGSSFIALLRREGRLDAALRIAKQRLSRTRASFGDRGNHLVRPSIDLGRVHLARGEMAAALAAFEGADAAFPVGDIEDHRRAPIDFGRARAMAGLAQGDPRARRRAMELARRAAGRYRNWGGSWNEREGDVIRWLTRQPARR